MRTLQQRQKWKQETTNAKVGDIVALKDENLPPQKWLLGRIVESHAGTDNKVRVGTLKIVTGTPTKAKLTTLPIVKLCPLLNEMDGMEETFKNQIQRKQGEQGIDQRRYSLKPRTRINPVTIAIALIGLLLLCGASDNPIKITPFQHNAGIYFENLAKSEPSTILLELGNIFQSREILSRNTVHTRIIQQTGKFVQQKVEVTTEELHCKDLNSMIRDR